MMKKMWKIRKDKSAVSPVIATILMVAITVVLAAVLYVMVMGFGGGNASTPTASLNVQKGLDNTTAASFYTISVLSISSNNVLYTDVSVTVVPAVAAQPTTISPSVAGSTHVQASDYVTLSLAKGVTYTVTLIYKPTGNAIASNQIVVPS
jgi:flagellin-like protein